LIEQELIDLLLRLFQGNTGGFAGMIIQRFSLFVDDLHFGIDLVKEVVDFHQVAILIISLMLSVTLFTKFNLAETELGDTNVNKGQGVMLAQMVDLNFVD
jgi:hypothetical protein